MREAARGVLANFINDKYDIATLCAYLCELDSAVGELTRRDVCSHPCTRPAIWRRVCSPIKCMQRGTRLVERGHGAPLAFVPSATLVDLAVLCLECVEPSVFL